MPVLIQTFESAQAKAAVSEKRVSGTANPGATAATADTAQTLTGASAAAAAVAVKENCEEGQWPTDEDESMPPDLEEL